MPISHHYIRRAILEAAGIVGEVQAAQEADVSVAGLVSASPEQAARVDGTPDATLLLQLTATGRLQAETMGSVDLGASLAVTPEQAARVTGAPDMNVILQLSETGRLQAATQATTTQQGRLAVAPEQAMQVDGAPDMHVVLQLTATGQIQAVTQATTTQEGQLAAAPEQAARVTGTPDLNLILQLAETGYVQAATEAATTQQGQLVVSPEQVARVTGTAQLGILHLLSVIGSVQATTEANAAVGGGAIEVSPEQAVRVTGFDLNNEAGVTNGMTLDAVWDDVATDYSDLNGATTASARLEATIKPGDTGVLMESGGTGHGLALYIRNGGTTGEEVLVGLFGEGSGTASDADTAKIEHTLNRRFSGQVNGTDIQYSGDLRGLVDADSTIFFPDEQAIGQITPGTYEVASVSFDSGTTTITLATSTGAQESNAPFVVEGERNVAIAWSADSSVGAVMYLNGTPIGVDAFDATEICGADDGGIEDQHGGGIRALDTTWSGSDYIYSNSVRRAHIFVGQSTGEVTSYITESDLGAPTATWEDESSTFTELTTVAAATGRAFVKIDDGSFGSGVGVIMESGASGDGLILYVVDDTLYFQAGDGATAGADADTVELSYIFPDHGPYVIEWVADVTWGARMWVNGQQVDSDTTFSYGGNLAGSNPGSLDRVTSSGLPANRGSYTTQQELRWACERVDVWQETPFSPVSFIAGNQNYTYDTQNGTGSHSADWEDGASNYIFRIYETSALSSLIYEQTGIGGTSDSDSGYNSPSLTDTDTVWFEVEDAIGQTDTIEVNVITI